MREPFSLVLAAEYVVENFAYDHCHLHGEVRGMLGQDCSRARPVADSGRGDEPPRAVRWCGAPRGRTRAAHKPGLALTCTLGQTAAMTVISERPVSTPSGPEEGPLDAASGSAWCWLCGTRQPTSLMVADGVSGCADTRWYCQDIGSCTSRWTEHRAIRRLELGQRV